MAKIGYTGFRFRETRGGTPDKLLALSMRGQGGVRLHIGDGRYVMMAEADAALSVPERTALVARRQPVNIVELSIASAATEVAAPAGIDLGDSLRQIELPKMLDISDKLSIMEGELTVGLFRQVMQGYVIEGFNADGLKAILDDPSQAGNTLTFVNLFDAREFAKRLSKQTGGKFRVVTNPEWDVAIKTGEKMSGRHLNWTETGTGPYTDVIILRSLAYAYPSYRYPEDRGPDCAVRLVKDK